MDRNAQENGSHKKVGIMGGTFNPIHMGHLLLAECARSDAGLDEVLFIPSGCSYMKEQSPILDPSLRLQMTRLAVADNPAFSVSSLEIERGGYTYTYETLEQLRREHPDTEYFFLVGADSLFAMENWNRPERIFASASILTAVRDDLAREELFLKARELESAYGARIQLLSFKRLEISSSDIRKRAAEGKSIRYLVPEAVREFICEHGLYIMN